MKKILLTLIVFFQLVVAIPVIAQTDYTLLAPLPLNGVSGGVASSTKAGGYIEGIFILIIAIAGGLAVVKIIFGGIKYMSTDAIGGKSDAKETISNAIWGLLLAISAWLILNTIDSKLTKFDLNIPKISSEVSSSGVVTAGGGVLPGYSLTTEQVSENTRIRELLKQQNVSVNNGPCINGETTGCTNVVGLPQTGIDKISNLTKACGCSIEITGGTEGGHLTHGPGLAVVDLASTDGLNKYLGYPNPKNGTRVVVGTTTYTYEAAGIDGSTGNHWHVKI